MGVDPTQRDAAVEGSAPVALPMPTGAAPVAHRGKRISLGPAVLPRGGFINYMAREISCRIVLRGPASAGKTTSLRWLAERVPGATLDRIDADDGARVLLFDALLSLEIRGFRVRVQVCTAPARPGHEAAREGLPGAPTGSSSPSGSTRTRRGQPRRLDSLTNHSCTKKPGALARGDPAGIFVQQARRPGRAARRAARRDARPGRGARFEATATAGAGLLEAFKALMALVMKALAGGNKLFETHSK